MWLIAFLLQFFFKSQSHSIDSPNIFTLRFFKHTLPLNKKENLMTKTHKDADADFQQFLSLWVTVWKRTHMRKHQSTFPVCGVCICRGSKRWGDYQIDTSFNTLQLPDTMQNQYSTHIHLYQHLKQEGHTHTHFSTLCCLLSWGLQLWLDHYSLLELPRGIPRICAHRVSQKKKACVSTLTACWLMAVTKLFFHWLIWLWQSVGFDVPNHNNIWLIINSTYDHQLWGS